MNGYQLTKAFYDEVESNEAMQLNCKPHHLSLYTWICELRNRTNRDLLDLPVLYTMQMTFIGSQHTLAKAIDDLAAWGIIDIVMQVKGHGTKVRLAIAFLQYHCNTSAIQEDSAIAEMQHHCNTTAIQVQTTKTNKTYKTKNIYRGRKKILEESTTADSQEEEPRITAPLPDPPPIEPLPLDPPPEPTAPDTSVRLNGKGQMIKPDLPTLTAFVLDKGGTKLMADEMFYFYTSKGWMVGKSPMKDWNAAARNWISRSKSTESAQAPQKKLIV